MIFYTLNRLVLIMKLTTAFMFAVILQVSASGFAQKITISANDAKLETLFKEISRQSGYDLIYNNYDIEGVAHLRVSLKNEALKKALEIILKGQDLTYVVKENTVVIRKKEKGLFDKFINVFTLRKRVTGKITDEKGLPLIGAIIKVKNQKAITQTTVDGTFAIDAEPGSVLEISFIGYKTREIMVTANTEALDLKLEQNISELDVVMVQGYREGSRRLNTGNVVSINSDEIKKQPVSNVLMALEGRLPGVSLTQVSGVPGSRLNMQIRGRANFDSRLSSDQPLFIVDGVPFPGGNTKLNIVEGPFGTSPTDGLSGLGGINPSDIDNITVLKDADATAIYGSRGANGVVIITTKKGKAGKTRLEANIYSGASLAAQTVKMLNTEQYIAMRNEAFANDKLTKTNDNAYDLLLWDNKRYTDIPKLLVGNTAQTTDAQLALTGGSKNVQYRIGSGYHRETTVWSGDNSSDRISLNFNLNSISDDEKFTVSLTGNYSVGKSNLLAGDLANAITAPPNLRFFDENGSLVQNEGGIEYDNPLITGMRQKYLSQLTGLNSNLLIGYKILKDLTLRSSFGYSTNVTNERRTIPIASLNPLSSTKTGSVTFGNNNFINWIIEPQLEYNRQIKKGKLSILLGATYNKNNNNGESINAGGYTGDELLGSLKGASPTGISVDNISSVYKYQAFFGRINYNLNDKYILNLTGRRDGSSRFGPDFSFSNFAAAGAAWLFGNEDFIKNIPFVSYGKLRASFGSTGNDQISNYAYLDSWTPTDRYTDSATLYPTKLYNPNLHWEKNYKTEIGLELGFLKDRILFTASAYRNISSEPLVSYPLARITGFSSIVDNLKGVKVRNRGLEFTLNTTNVRTENFEWTSNFNITVPQNTLLKYPDLDKSSYAWQYKIGESLNRIIAFQYLGVDPNTGEYTVRDVDGDGALTDKDYVKYGNRDPKFFGGLNNTFTYKRFSASFFLQFIKQTGMDWRVQGSTNPPGSLLNQPVMVLDRWQSAGQITNVQKYTTSIGTFSGPTGFYAAIRSNIQAVDASYVRLKNVSIAYDIPVKWLKSNSFKVFLQGQNLLTFTNYKGGDPEIQSYLRMPTLRTITGGIQLSL